MSERTEDRSRTTKGQRARARILAAAEPLLATRGFYGASMRDLAAAARLPLATVVYHFAHKEQLYAALLDEIGGDLMRLLDEADRLRTRRARVESFATNLVGWMLEHETRVRLIGREVLDNSQRIARAAHLPFAQFLLKAGAFIGEGRARGEPVFDFLHLFGGVAFAIASRPTLDRMRAVGRGARLDTARHQRAAVAYAQRMMGLDDARRR